MTFNKAVARLARVRSLREIRQQRMMQAWHRSVAQREAVQQALEEIEQALSEVARERARLFEQHRGLLSRGSLFALRRRDSALETRRIYLSLDHAQQESNLQKCMEAEKNAHMALIHAQRQYEKLTYVFNQYRRQAVLRTHWRDDHDIEEDHYVH